MTLSVKSTLDSGGFDRGVSRMEGKTKSFSSQMKGLGQTIAAVFAFQKVLQFGNEVVQLGSKLSDLATMTGLTTTQIQALELASVKAGVAPEKIRTGITALTRAVAEAVSGTASYVDAFEALGISVDDIAGKNIDEVFEKVAVAVSEAKGDVQKLGEASTIFGSRVSASFTEVFDQVAEAGGSLDGLAENFDGIMDEDTIRQLDDFADLLLEIKRTILGFSAENAIKAIEVLKEAAAFAGAALVAATDSAVDLDEALDAVIKDQVNDFVRAANAAAQLAEEEEKAAAATRERIAAQRGQGASGAGGDGGEKKRQAIEREIEELQKRITQREFEKLELATQRARIEQEISQLQGDTGDATEVNRLRIQDQIGAKQEQLAKIEESLLQKKESTEQTIAQMKEKQADREEKIIGLRQKATEIEAERLEQIEDARTGATISPAASTRLGAIGGFSAGAGQLFEFLKIDRQIQIQEDIRDINAEQEDSLEEINESIQELDTTARFV